MSVYSSSLLDDLHHVDWRTAARTFGNSHATLVGLLAQWWIQMSPHANTVVEAGPSNGYRLKGKRGQCDALFCTDDSPVGVLEVEGTRPTETAKKIGYFFDALYPELQQLAFGILFVYSYAPVERGSLRHFPAALTPEITGTVKSVTIKHTAKAIVLVGLNKELQRLRNGIRSKNEYYMGLPTRIHGQLIVNGSVIRETTYYAKDTT